MDHNCEEESIDKIFEQSLGDDYLSSKWENEGNVCIAADVEQKIETMQNFVEGVEHHFYIQ